MPDQDVSIHIRLPAFLLERVRQQAARRRRSVAAEIAIIVEDSMDVAAPCRDAADPAVSVPMRPDLGVSRPVRTRVTNADRLLDAVQEAVRLHGNPVPASAVRALYSRAGAHVSTFYASRDRLIARGVIERDGDMIRLC